MKRILTTIIALLFLVSTAWAADKWITWNNNEAKVKIESEDFVGYAMSTTVSSAKPWKLHGFRLHLSSAPSTSESFTVTRDALDGATYDVLLYTRDLSVGSVTDIVYKFDPPEMLSGGDKIVYVYTNTDERTITLESIYERQ